jgi:hypothetical protein
MNNKIADEKIPFQKNPFVADPPSDPDLLTTLLLFYASAPKFFRLYVPT